jgi:glyoxylase-like metal-dependent hydrolase (beta-lactamase superfamily II)
MGRSPLPGGWPAGNTRDVKRIVILAGAGSLLAAGAVVAGRRRAGSSGAVAVVVPTQIAPDVFCVGPWGRTQTNVYLVRAGASWVLVDAGWAQDAERIRSAVRSVAGPETVPSAILLTHVHPDHSGSARELASAWDCPILVHPDEIPIATGDFAAMTRYAGPMDRWLILPLMRVIGRHRREAILEQGSLGGSVHPLEPDGSIPSVDGWRWAHTPGHTPGHVAFVRSLDRVVISGDALVTLRVNAAAGLLWGSQGLSAPPWYTTWDRDAAHGSIRAIADLEPSVLAGGHGRPLTGSGTAAAVREFAAER